MVGMVTWLKFMGPTRLKMYRRWMTGMLAATLTALVLLAGPSLVGSVYQPSAPDGAINPALAASFNLRSTIGRTLPGRTSAVVSVSPFEQVQVSGLKYAHHRAFFGVFLHPYNETAGTIQIYGFRQSRWVIRGSVGIPLCCQNYASFSVAHLTPGSPSFVVNSSGGAGDGGCWVSVVSRLRNHWRVVPFRPGGGPQISFHSCAVHGRLVLGFGTTCACAFGVGTASYFRFNGQFFVPVKPPGYPPTCSATTLDVAAPMQHIHGIAGAFRAARFACVKGWALAAGLRDGSRRLALFYQVRHSWSRVAFAKTPRGMRWEAGGFAIPPVVLWSLARGIGQSWPRLGNSRQGLKIKPCALGPCEHVGAARASTIKITLGPGVNIDNLGVIQDGPHVRWRVEYDAATSWYPADSVAPARSKPKWTAISTEKDVGELHQLSLYVYLWSEQGWNRQGEVTLRFHGGRWQRPAPWWENFTPVSVPGTRPPLFLYWPGDIFGTPSWLLALGHVHAEWRDIPFDTPFGARRLVQAVSANPRTIQAYAGPSLKVWYRYSNGRYRVARRRMDPACQVRELGSLAKHPFSPSSAACAYGWALASGRIRRKTVVAEFEAGRQKWLWQMTTGAKGVLPNMTGFFNMPRWLATQLLEEVSRRKQTLLLARHSVDLETRRPPRREGRLPSRR